MTTIDAHQHFWRRGSGRYQWPPAISSRFDGDFTPGDLGPELARAGIDRTILMQSVNSAEETEELLELAGSLDMVAGVVGWVPLMDGVGTRTALDRLARHSKLVGVRHLINFESDPDWLLQPVVMETIKMLSERELVFDTVPVNARHLEAVHTIATRYPRMAVVIDHLARPPIRESGWQPWADGIARVAACPNVSIKLSAGLDVVIDWRWSAAEMRRYADHVFACFGTQRVMFASNWPIVLLAGSYLDMWSETKKLLGGLSAQERGNVLGGNAERVYGLAA